MATVRGRRQRAGHRAGGGQKPLELHAGRAPRLGGPRTPGHGVHAVSGPHAGDGHGELRGSGHFRRIRLLGGEQRHNAGFFDVRAAFGDRAVPGQRQPLRVPSYRPTDSRPGRRRARVRPARD